MCLFRTWPVNRKMPPGVKPLTEAEKRAAIELWKANVPLKKVREQMKMSERGLRNILAYAKSHPQDPIPKKKKNAGPPTKVSLGAIREIKRALNKNPCITAKVLKKKIPVLANVSVRTIQRTCHDTLKLPSRKMADKPLLTDRMKNARLEFARQYEHWGVEEWRKVMFSDESHFELRFGNQNYRCRRAKGSDRFDPKFTRKRVKHPQKVMAWACFSWRGRGGLEFLKKGEMMNGVRYVQVLGDKLVPFMQIHGTTHFLQDGAPCHRAKIVSDWFKERPDIQLIKWPGNSPDFNPIENVWSWMKLQLQETHPTNLEELKEEIRKMWTTCNT